MQKIHRILVAIKDPEAASLPALDKALQLAQAFGASLDIYHAIAEPVYMEYELSDQSLRALTETRVAAYRKKLESLAARAAALRVSANVSVDWDYPPYQAIVRRAH